MFKNLLVLGLMFFALYTLRVENRLLKHKFEYQKEIYTNYFDSLYTVLDSLKNTQ